MDNFLAIIVKPDNIPIVGMVLIFGLALWWSIRQSIRHAPEIDTDAPGKLHTWPYLTRVELLAALVLIIVLIIWSILIDAPLEEAANPTVTPNPAKAPWYFLGLQEMLVYFDPWIAGVVLPSLIIIGLMLIPYLDTNEKGNGSYSLIERPFAASVFIFGFFVLGLMMIVLGVFFRGPGWNFFWPWEYWDPHKVVAITNVDLPQALGIMSPAGAFIIGAICVLGWYGSGVVYYIFFRRGPVIIKLGLVRYVLVSFLLLTMLAVPVKVLLRLLFNIKYVWVTPWFNV